MMRLRSGNRYASGGVPGGASDNSRPCSATARHRARCSRGYTTSRPEATTAIGRPPPLGLQRAAVRAAVDAPGETRHDVHVGVGELPTERRRRVAAGSRGVAGADDGRAAPVEQTEIALGEHHRRRQRIVEQQRRIVRRHRAASTCTPSRCAALPHLVEQRRSAGALPRGAHVAVVEHTLDQPRRVAARPPQPRTPRWECGGAAAPRADGSSCAGTRRAPRRTPAVAARRARCRLGVHATCSRIETRSLTRSCSASATCCSPTAADMSPSRSARVRATRRMRW